MCIRDRKDDYPPEREFTDPLPPGPWPRMPGSIIDREKYDELLTEYYKAHGWDKKDGIPTREKLEELNLNDVAQELGKSLMSKI